jgi:hypothetical protein
MSFLKIFHGILSGLTFPSKAAFLRVNVNLQTQQMLF